MIHLPPNTSFLGQRLDQGVPGTSGAPSSPSTPLDAEARRWKGHPIAGVVVMEKASKPPARSNEFLLEKTMSRCGDPGTHNGAIKGAPGTGLQPEAWGGRPRVHMRILEKVKSEETRQRKEQEVARWSQVTPSQCRGRGRSCRCSCSEQPWPRGPNVEGARCWTGGGGCARVGGGSPDRQKGPVSPTMWTWLERGASCGVKGAIGGRHLRPALLRCGMHGTAQGTVGDGRESRTGVPGRGDA